MFTYKIATFAELERIWDKKIAENLEDTRYLRWKAQFLADNLKGAAVTFLVMADEEPVGEGTLLLSPDCRAIRQRTSLCDGTHTANINNLRIEKAFEGQCHISTLRKAMEQYAKERGIRRLTIGVEAAETRNLGIYLHWGYDQFLMSEEEDGALILYYGKDLS